MSKPELIAWIIQTEREGKLSEPYAVIGKLKYVRGVHADAANPLRFTTKLRFVKHSVSPLRRHYLPATNQTYWIKYGKQ